MGRTLLFLAAESLLFAALLGLSWMVVRRAFALLGVTLGRLGFLVLPVLWGVLLGINIAFTHIWGPSFTALYRLSGATLLGAIAIYALCLIVRRTRTSATEPS